MPSNVQSTAKYKSFLQGKFISFCFLQNNYIFSSTLCVEIITKGFQIAVTQWECTLFWYNIENLHYGFTCNNKLVSLTVNVRDEMKLPSAMGYLFY